MPKKKKPCGCPEEKHPGISDDDRFNKWIKPSLIEAMTPVEFTLTLHIRAAIDLEYAEELLNRFSMLKKVPDSDDEVLTIVDELNAITDMMNELEEAILTDIENNEWSAAAIEATVSGVQMDIEVDVNDA